MRYIAAIMGILAGTGVMAAVFVVGASVTSRIEGVSEPAQDAPPAPIATSDGAEVQVVENEGVIEEPPLIERVEEVEITTTSEEDESLPAIDIEDDVVTEEMSREAEASQISSEDAPSEAEIFEIDEEAIPQTDWEGLSRDLSQRADLWSFEGELIDYARPAPEEPDADRVLPPSLNVIIAETVDYRLDRVDLVDLPSEVTLALWPDSPLTLVDRKYFLINPPTNIMELYYVQSVVGDEYDFYFDTMKNAEGIFVRGDDHLIAQSNASELFMKSMAGQGKEVLVMPSDLPPEIIAQARGVNLNLVESDATLTEENFDEKWPELLQSAEHGEDLQIVIEARGASVEKFQAAMKVLNAKKANGVAVAEDRE